MRDTDVRLVHCAEPDVWDSLVLSTPGGTAFHEWSFLDLQERMLGVHVERLLVVAGGPVGVVPVTRRTPNGWRSPWLPFPFLGPAVPEALLGAVLHALRRWQRRHGLLLERFDVAPSLFAATAAHAPRVGMRIRPDATVVVPLAGRSIAELDSRMSRMRRRSIRKAEQRGASARRAAPGETAAMLGTVLEQAYLRRGAVSPYPRDVGGLIEQWAAGRDDVYLCSAYVDDVQVGSIVVLGWHEVAIAWVGAVLSDSLDTRAGDVMHRDLLGWAAGRGRTALDLSGRVDDAVERYKVSLGGHVEPYGSVTSFLGPQALLKALHR